VRAHPGRNRGVAWHGGTRAATCHGRLARTCRDFNPAENPARWSAGTIGAGLRVCLFFLCFDSILDIEASKFVYSNSKFIFFDVFQDTRLMMGV
jgi:hypothetical protein